MSRIPYRDFEAAANRVKGYIRRTPLIPCAPAMLVESGAEVRFKPECLQVSGSFKARGAFNSILSLDAEAMKNGVVTASGGNFGAALAYAGKVLGIPARIVVMQNSTQLVRDRIRAYGAELLVEGAHWDLSWEAGKRIAAETGAQLLHPFATPEVIAGQGTIGVELLDDWPDVDTIVVSIGGGGLIGGIAEAVKQRKPSTRIVGVETRNCPTLYGARQAGHIVRYEDFTTNVPILAARTTEPINFEIVQANVDELVIVEEDRPKEAARWIWANTGLAIELGAATSVAAVRDGTIKTGKGERVAIVLCGSGDDGLN